MACLLKTLVSATEIGNTFDKAVCAEYEKPYNIESVSHSPIIAIAISASVRVKTLI